MLVFRGVDCRWLVFEKCCIVGMLGMLYPRWHCNTLSNAVLLVCSKNLGSLFRNQIICNHLQSPFTSLTKCEITQRFLWLIMLDIIQVGVSKNRGYPQIMNFNWVFQCFPLFSPSISGGFPPNFGNIQITTIKGTPSFTEVFIATQFGSADALPLGIPEGLGRRDDDICARVKSRYMRNGHPTFNRESLQWVY